MDKAATDVEANILILIVDDEPKVCRSLVGLLAPIGYRTAAAESGHAALEILERDPVDIVITDEMMAGMSGTLLLETVRKRWPRIRRMLFTAHAEPDVVIDAVNRGGVHKVLPKACNRAELEGAVAELAKQVLLLRARDSGSLADVVTAEELQALLGDADETS